MSQLWSTPHRSTPVDAVVALPGSKSITARALVLAALAAALAPALAVERELAGGGMARVFVALEAALGVPVTMLLSDPGQTGARATAETLDLPLELEMRDRRELWGDAQRRILDYVITESVRAGKGALKGTVKTDPVTGREVHDENGVYPLVVED